jgi:UDP-N-acetylglucosamine 2-epimerase (non-hydrolysing)
MVTQIAKWHFAPTKESAENIVRSNVAKSEVVVTGNTVIDALHLACEKIEQPNVVLDIPADIFSSTQKMVLITGHRRENFGDGLDNLCAAIRELATDYPDVNFVFPVHLNPTVQRQVMDKLKVYQQANVKLIAPLGYLEFVWLMKNSLFIITDSGGIQEEAPGLGKPVLVTRDTTERPEGVDAGTVKLVGTSKDSLVSASKQLLDDKVHYESMAKARNPYGDGKAVARIIQTLLT